MSSSADLSSGENDSRENNSVESSPNQAIIDELDVSNFNQLVPHLACEFNFQLDDFQARSIYRLQRNESVFVSAPTSAGKTVVAQYAISLSLLHKKRVIYTAPIKALSNQKYREFSQKFQSVGILTGDITLNRDAPILIMTTEVLCSMLKQNDDIIQSVEWVIFDEFHYISDEERGSVWEESIIRMPQNINMVFLSASIPNAKEIASWIAEKKEKPVYIEIHTQRPVPLSHCLFSSNKFYTIVDPVDGQPKFDEDTYHTAKRDRKIKEKSSSGVNPYYINLVKHLRDHDLLPALMFEFSIGSIEAKSHNLAQQVNLITHQDSQYVIHFFNRTIERIPQEDRDLPQIKSILFLLQRGIGIHHSGLLPILKETVEILLSEGKLKIVFCTSSIGMGLNLPVRTCCFLSMKKYSMREKTSVFLTNAEYQQMSGRAGRRGLDANGTSVLCVTDEFPSLDYLSNMVLGQPEELRSQFQLSFKMILMSFTGESGLQYTDIVQKSLMANSNENQKAKIEGKLEELNGKLAALGRIENCPHSKSGSDDDIEDILNGKPIKEFTDIYLRLCAMNAKVFTKFKLRFLHSLKKWMIVLYTENGAFKLGIIEKAPDSKEIKLEELPVTSLFFPTGETVQISSEKSYKHLHLLSLPTASEAKKLTIKDKRSLIQNFNPENNYVTYDVIFSSKKGDLKDAMKKYRKTLFSAFNSSCFKCPAFSEHLTVSSEFREISQRVHLLTDQLAQMDKDRIAFDSYLSLLKDMDYVTCDPSTNEFKLNLRGYIAAKVYGNELISTELLIDDIFDDLDPAEIAALCSILVASKAGLKNEGADIPEAIEDEVDRVEQIGENVVKKMVEQKVPFDRENFLRLSVNTKAVMAVYVWAKGGTFGDVMRHAQTIREGHMINIINKDISLMNNFATLAEEYIGLKELAEKFRKAAECIRRGIVLTRSIYLDEDEDEDE